MKNTHPTQEQQFAVRQPYLGNKGLILFITLMNMFIPLSTDLYLPALPGMSAYFHSSSSVTNLTLSSFFFFYAVGILFWGPLSDKYGRKPILLAGSIIYIASSAACALSPHVYMLILARVMQGIGAGGITAVSVAMIKDCFSGKKRETILALTQSVSGLAPMLAPVIGAILLKFFSWQGSFWTLAAIGVVSLLLTVLYKETLKEEERYNGTLLGSIGRLVTVSRNRSFFVPAVIFSLSALPFMGYIAISSYIYVDYFGLSEQVYSYYFAANAMISIAGPFVYVRFLRELDKKNFVIACFGLSVLSGILVMTVGTLTPILFLLSFLFMSLAGAVIRPFSSNLLFNQLKGDTGSASSLMNTLFTVLGSIGMAVASLPWDNMVVGLGILISLLSAIALVSWNAFMKSSIPCAGVKHEARTVSA